MKPSISSNPFSTRFVQPGAIEYRRHDGRSLETLVETFWKDYRGWGAILGPHGTGKSTLLASLKPHFAPRHQVWSYRFSSTQRTAQPMWEEARQWSTGNVLLVDGYEQLSWLDRWHLCRRARRAGCGLLITAHHPHFGFRCLWQTHIDEQAAVRLRDELLKDRPDLLTAADLESVWKQTRHRHPTDLRETWMKMYDWVESHR